MTSTANKQPAQPAPDYELKGRSLEEILEAHLAWAWGQRYSKHSLAMRSSAIEGNIKLRIELRKVDKAQASETEGLEKLYELLSDDESKAAPADDAQGRAGAEDADRGDPAPARS